MFWVKFGCEFWFGNVVWRVCVVGWCKVHHCEVSIHLTSFLVWCFCSCLAPYEWIGLFGQRLGRAIEENENLRSECKFIGHVLSVLNV